MRRVEWEWDTNLEGILSRTESIRVSSAHTSKENIYSIMQAGKHRDYDYSTPVLLSYFSIAFDAETNIYIMKTRLLCVCLLVCLSGLYYGDGEMEIVFKLRRVSVALRRITHKQRPLRGHCLFV